MRVMFLSAAVLASTSAAAFEVDLGVEGGAAVAFSQNVTGSELSGTAGLLLQLRWPVGPLETAIWVDAGLPYSIGTATDGSNVVHTASYFPDDLGLRLGLRFSRVRPYVGALVEADAQVGSGFASTSFIALGGDAGFDVVVGSFRIGLELRAAWSVTALTSCDFCDASIVTFAGRATVLRGLLSVRYVL
ncbi:MAG TPA: hypothetical protein VMB50_17410 [Myxococcales bacterium]|nr:hypothetical protein [Myxococcales bacterium]